MKRIALACSDAFAIAGVLSANLAKSPYFTFVNIKEDQIVGFEVFKNPYLLKNQSGLIPRFISTRRAEVMIVSKMDAKSLNLFKKLGIEIAVGAQGRVLDIIEAYLKGGIQDKSEASVSKDGSLQPEFSATIKRGCYPNPSLIKLSEGIIIDYPVKSHNIGICDL